jgi:hypothetical protein
LQCARSQLWSAAQTAAQQFYGTKSAPYLERFSLSSKLGCTTVSGHAVLCPWRRISYACRSSHVQQEGFGPAACGEARRCPQPADKTPRLYHHVCHPFAFQVRSRSCPCWHELGGVLQDPSTLGNVICSVHSSALQSHLSTTVLSNSPVTTNSLCPALATAAKRQLERCLSFTTSHLPAAVGAKAHVPLCLPSSYGLKYPHVMVQAVGPSDRRPCANSGPDSGRYQESSMGHTSSVRCLRHIDAT